MEKYAIITSPRSGSSLFRTTLNAHQNIACHGEIFNSTNAIYSWKQFPKWNPKDVKNMPELFLKYIYGSSVYHRDTTHVGFKIHFHQNDNALNLLVNDNSVKKIVLYRQDLLAQYASTVIMNQGKILFNKNESTKVKVDIQEFKKYINRMKSRYTAIVDDLKQLNQPFEIYSYEQLVELEEFDRIFDFLGIENKTIIKPSFTKVNPPTNELIINFDEVNKINHQFVLR